MGRQLSRARRLLRAASLLGAVAGLTFVFVPAATESSTHDGLQASVESSNRGPLPACSGSDCTTANATWNFVYVANKNDLTNANGGTTRETLPNAFVVSGVEQTIFVDGQQVGSSYTFTPPPDVNFPRSYSGHWPSTVKCPSSGPPCNEVHSPAVVPGEEAAVIYAGWQHEVGEPNGKYVFQYTVHGTLNGAPVDVTASSQPIFMTN